MATIHTPASTLMGTPAIRVSRAARAAHAGTPEPTMYEPMGANRTVWAQLDRRDRTRTPLARARSIFTRQARQAKRATYIAL